MNNRFFKYLFLLVCVWSLAPNTFGQKTRTQQLKAKEIALKKQLAETQELLSATKKSQNTTLSELRIINKQIAYKEELLMNMNSQIKETTLQIKQNKEQITTLNRDLEKLKKEFISMMRFAYKNRKKEYNAMYLFSSENYSQAYRRMKYIDQYTLNRKRNILNWNISKKLRKTRSFSAICMKNILNKFIFSFSKKFKKKALLAKYVQIPFLKQ